MEPNSQSKEGKLELSYASPEGWAAMARPAGVALLIWASLALLLTTALSVALVTMWVMQAVRTKWKDFVPIGLLLLLVIGICALLYYRSLHLFRGGYQLFSRRNIDLQPPIESVTATAAFLGICGGIAGLGALGSFGFASLLIAGGLCCLAGGLAHIRHLLAKVQRAKIRVGD